MPGVVVHTSGPAIEAEIFGAVEVTGRAVLLRTDWSRHWATERYGGPDHPYLSAAAADALVANGATLVGIDSVNIDGTATGERPAHSALLAAGIPIVEHLAHLEELPTEGFQFFAVPPAVEDMGTFPVRAFAIVP